LRELNLAHNWIQEASLMPFAFYDDLVCLEQLDLSSNMIPFDEI